MTSTVLSVVVVLAGVETQHLQELGAFDRVRGVTGYSACGLVFLDATEDLLFRAHPREDLREADEVGDGDGLEVRVGGCKFTGSEDDARDAVAEEKVEQTLGLLRMTGLSPLSILLGKSTSRQHRLIVKILIIFVKPGVGETRARPTSPASIFNKDDLPTLERPMKANSGSVSSGQ